MRVGISTELCTYEWVCSMYITHPHHTHTHKQTHTLPLSLAFSFTTVAMEASWPASLMTGLSFSSSRSVFVSREHLLLNNHSPTARINCVTKCHTAGGGQVGGRQPRTPEMIEAQMENMLRCALQPLHIPDGDAEGKGLSAPNVAAHDTLPTQHCLQPIRTKIGNCSSSSSSSSSSRAPEE